LVLSIVLYQDRWRQQLNSEVINAVYLVCRHLEMGMNAREALEQFVAPKACFCVARRVLVGGEAGWCLRQLSVASYCHLSLLRFAAFRWAHG
jgi:hypothetical protein